MNEGAESEPSTPLRVERKGRATRAPRPPVPINEKANIHFHIQTVKDKPPPLGGRAISLEFEPPLPKEATPPTVLFPYAPYPVQLEMIGKLLQAVATRSVALLESPTGSGKSLVLLTSVLAYVANQPITESAPAIIYFSRTHSQLSQVLRELRKTAYSPVATVMGSRDQLCINPQLSGKRGIARNKACETEVKNHRCIYYKNLRAKGDDLAARFEKRAMDIEDLCKLGRADNICPYHLARDLLPQSNLVLMPYAYILQHRQREKHANWFKDAILIFDEAHNVLEEMEQGASFAFTLADVEGALRELDRAEEIGIHTAPESRFSATQLKAMKRLLPAFARSIAKASNDMPGAMKIGNEIFSLFGDESEIGLEQLRVFCAGVEALVAAARGGELWPGKLDEIGGALQILRQLWADANLQIAGFRLLLGDSSTPRLELMCLTPAFTFSRILALKPRTMLFTSGTLTPFSLFEAELGTSIPLSFIGRHRLGPSQVFAAVVTRLNGAPLNLSLRNRLNTEQTASIGRSLLSWAAETPQGMLVVFSSYAVMHAFLSDWRNAGLLTRLATLKRVFVESRDVNEQAKNLCEYCVAARQGAVYLSVACGKLSEGFDFADFMARLVVVIGVPYPNFGDVRVRAKRELLGANRGKGPTPEEWYSGRAMRAANQAIGRVIRHSRDFGAVLLLDERFAQTQLRSLLSEWVREHIVTLAESAEVGVRLKRFFAENSKNLNFVNKPLEEISFPDFGSLPMESEHFAQQNSESKAICALKTQKSNDLNFSVQKSKEISNQIEEKSLKNVLSFVPRRSQHFRKSLAPSSREKQQLTINSFSIFRSAEKPNAIFSKRLSPTDGALAAELGHCRAERQTAKVNRGEADRPECIICCTPGAELFASRCGHVACEECWTRYLVQKRNCYVCKKKVSSKRALTRLFF